MPIRAEGAVSAALAISLDGHDFGLVASLAPDYDASSTVQEFSPQGRYAKRNVVPLNDYGHGSFCKFRISVPTGLSGVYALVVDGSVRYIGECEDMRKRFNLGYGNISPRNCYRGGQPTNCKINRRVLDVSKAGGRVGLYFQPTSPRKAIEKHLIARLSPPWNGRSAEVMEAPISSFGDQW